MSKFIQANGRVIYTQTHLTREQKEAVGLLSIGTFLEFFDLTYIFPLLTTLILQL
ncbi:hypothetical protein [Candidatus Tisiphia endosymbiont of Micropterix aruncella]|uniref:hypothetical protein n=1 Tax=Candidatus Tisiphia endosymbiont of Micropterix aruncella TaxID=3066271 RepID=UPI003AA7CBE7